jgi:hypothetical protein
MPIRPNIMKNRLGVITRSSWAVSSTRPSRTLSLPAMRPPLVVARGGVGAVVSAVEVMAIFLRRGVARPRAVISGA